MTTKRRLTRKRPVKITPDDKDGIVFTIHFKSVSILLRGAIKFYEGRLGLAMEIVPTK